MYVWEGRKNFIAHFIMRIPEIWRDAWEKAIESISNKMEALVIVKTRSWTISTSMKPNLLYIRRKPFRYRRDYKFLNNKYHRVD